MQSVRLAAIASISDLLPAARATRGLLAHILRIFCTAANRRYFLQSSRVQSLASLMIGYAAVLELARRGCYAASATVAACFSCGACCPILQASAEPGNFRHAANCALQEAAAADPGILLPANNFPTDEDLAAISQCMNGLAARVAKSMFAADAVLFCLAAMTATTDRNRLRTLRAGDLVARLQPEQLGAPSRYPVLDDTSSFADAFCSLFCDDPLGFPGSRAVQSTDD